MNSKKNTPGKDKNTSKKSNDSIEEKKSALKKGSQKEIAEEFDIKKFLEEFKPIKDGAPADN